MAEAVERWVAAALLVTPDGRYLLQLRDPKPEIVLPDHWACFGGGVEPGESAAQAVRREIKEELDFPLRKATAFTEMVIHLPFKIPQRTRMSFFVAPIAITDIAAMVQHEGADMALFRPEALIDERVSPWDLGVILMHSRRRALFGG